MRIERGIKFTRALHCRACLHIGSIALYIGTGPAARGAEGWRLEVGTARRWWRVRRGKKNAGLGAVVRKLNSDNSLCRGCARPAQRAVNGYCQDCTDAMRDDKREDMLRDRRDREGGGE